MKETEEVASRRKACKEMKELLQRALEILNEVSTARCTCVSSSVYSDHLTRDNLCDNIELLKLSLS